MWIASTLGFFSIVEKKPGEFQIRAREQRDLENAKAACMDIRYTKIVETPQGDYRYRLVVTKAQAMAFIMAAGQSINYSNFKDAVKHTEGQEHKVGAYMTIWSSMGRLQPGGPYGHDSHDTRGALPFYSRQGHYTGELAFAPATANTVSHASRRTWRRSENDGLLHAVGCSAKRTSKSPYLYKGDNGMQGVALCGAESNDWKQPVPANTQRCQDCQELYGD